MTIEGSTNKAREQQIEIFIDKIYKILRNITKSNRDSLIETLLHNAGAVEI